MLTRMRVCPALSAMVVALSLYRSACHQPVPRCIHPTGRYGCAAILQEVATWQQWDQGHDLRNCLKSNGCQASGGVSCSCEQATIPNRFD